MDGMDILARKPCVPLEETKQHHVSPITCFGTAFDAHGQQKQFEKNIRDHAKTVKKSQCPMPSKTSKVQPHCGDGKVSVRIGSFIEIIFCMFCHLPVVALPTNWISKSCQTDTWHWHSVMPQTTIWIPFDLKHDAEENNRNKKRSKPWFCFLSINVDMDDVCLLVTAFWSCFLEFRAANTTNQQLNHLDLICMVHGTYVTKHCTV